MSKQLFRIVLIGHRGVGKTSTLSRLKQYFPQARVADLDKLVEEANNLTTQQFFEKNGEEAFRIEEKKQAQLWVASLSDGEEAVLSVGAGFQGAIPRGFECVHIRRDSDDKGRIFLDRPRLSSHLSDINEAVELYKKRRVLFEQKRDRVWSLSEGAFFPDDNEKRFFKEDLEKVGGAFTLMPEFFRRRSWQQNLSSLVKQGVSVFELRDDLLSSEQIQEAASVIPFEKRLISYRTNPKGKFGDLAANWVDWDLELGENHDRKISVLSYHSRDTDIGQTLAKLDPYVAKTPYLKFAPKIQDFFELEKVHRWAQRHSPKVLFFPRSVFESSQAKRWQWYRLLNKGQALNFWREAEGPSLDQPTLFQWLNTPSRVQYFGAVLGSPVSDSYSPAWQKTFFQKRAFPFFSIDIPEEEFSDELLHFLKDLGLRWAAVTSPLKKKLFEAELIKDSQAQEFSSVNTIAWNATKQNFEATNTDYYGFAALVEDIPKNNAVIWGGGGVLSTVKKAFPTAAHYGARDGLLKSGVACDPHTLIWAAGPKAAFPAQLWNPKRIIDLSYSDRSHARAYAKEVGAHYRSGLKMFARQGARQRVFWKRFTPDP